MIFHTEVIVCPRSAFEQDASFLNTLDGMVASIAPARTESHIDAHETQKQYAFLNEGVQHYASIPKSQWSTQSTPTCVQLGYGGASCATPCCSVPHAPGKNVAYPLNSQDAVIGNAMGEYKELYLYGTSDTTKGGLSGEDAFNAVCRFYSNKEPGSLSGFFGSTNDESLPKCVSTWAGTDYNPITNNCNTFTSTVLKCVFGLSDAKPHLGVSDMISVQCPLEKNTIEGTEKEVQQCLIPVNKETHSKYSGDNALEME